MLNQLRELPKLLMAASLLVAATANPSRADEIAFLCASALRPAMDQLIADFQKTSGHKITVSYANLGTIVDRLRKGVRADLSVTSPQQWESLQADRKLVPDFKILFAEVGLGVAVRRGSAKPDLGSSAAVRRTLLNVRAVAFGDPAHGSPSGADALRLFERLDIAAQMKSKSMVLRGSVEIVAAVAEGAAELGIVHTSVIAASPRVELAGALPPDLRYLTVFVAGIPENATRVEAAKSFVRFLASPAAAAEFEAKGMKPSR